MRSMQVADRIETIVNRAAGINLSLFSLCKQAEVDYGQVHHWRLGEVNPTVKKFEQVTSQLETKLSELEEQMLRNLAGRCRRRA